MAVEAAMVILLLFEFKDGELIWLSVAGCDLASLLHLKPSTCGSTMDDGAWQVCIWVLVEENCLSMCCYYSYVSAQVQLMPYVWPVEDFWIVSANEKK